MSDDAKVVGNGNGLPKETYAISAQRRGLLGNLYSDEWYTTEIDAKIAIELLEPKGVVMCPFDSEKSEFVKLLKASHSVIYGINDFLTNEYDFDCVITNPPFSLKNEVIERCAASKKPSCLILPMDILSGIKRRKLYLKYGYPAVFIPAYRMAFRNEKGELQKGSNFTSVYVLFNTKHQGIKWL